MKKYVLMLAFGTVVAFAQAQSVEPPRTIADGPIPEQMPEFPGGLDTIRKYLSQNIRLPDEVKKDKVQGKVYVAFMIDEQGNVQHATIVKGLSKVCDEEAVRLISQMPRWKPGKQNGKVVPVKYILPVVFSRKTK